MQKPREFPTAIAGAVSICTFIYACAGALAYYGWGDAVCGDVNNSMVYPSQHGGNPCKDGYTGKKMLLGTVLSVAIVANLLVTFPIIMNVVYRAAEHALRVEYSIPLRLAIVALILLGGACLPYFFPFFGLLSAFLGVPVGVFVPMALYGRLNQESGPPVSEQKPLVMKHLFITFMGSVAMVFGTYDALKDLIKAFNT